MSARLEIRVAGQLVAEMPAPPDAARVGRGGGCDVRIDHAEIPEQAAQITSRGGAYLVQNLCPYDIYVGSQLVAPHAWAQWPSGQELRLSRNVGLLLTADATTAAPGKTPAAAGGSAPESSEKAENRRKMIQLGVTIGCLGLGALLLLGDRGATTSTESEDRFEDLLKELREKKPPGPRDAVLQEYLQNAWKNDQRRKSSEGRAEALRYYRLLINEPDIAVAATDRSTLSGRLKIFAARRIAALSAPP